MAAYDGWRWDSKHWFSISRHTPLKRTLANARPPRPPDTPPLKRLKQTIGGGGVGVGLGRNKSSMMHCQMRSLDGVRLDAASPKSWAGSSG